MSRTVSRVITVLANSEECKLCSEQHIASQLQHQTQLYPGSDLAAYLQSIYLYWQMFKMANYSEHCFVWSFGFVIRGPNFQDVEILYLTEHRKKCFSSAHTSLFIFTLIQSFFSDLNTTQLTVSCCHDN